MFLTGQTEIYLREPFLKLHLDHPFMYRLQVSATDNIKLCLSEHRISHERFFIKLLNAFYKPTVKNVSHRHGDEIRKGYHITSLAHNLIRIKDFQNQKTIILIENYSRPVMWQCELNLHNAFYEQFSCWIILITSSFWQPQLNSFLVT